LTSEHLTLPHLNREFSLKHTAKQEVVMWQPFCILYVCHNGLSPAQFIIQCIKYEELDK